MKEKIFIFFIGFFLSIQSMVYAVESGVITVSGIITDKETNESVPLANVMAVNADGTAINKDVGVLGTTSDMDGKFTLADVPSDAKIKISFVGYATQTIAAGQNIDIKLEPDSTQLDEVQAVAKAIEDGDPCEKTNKNIKTGKYKKVDKKWVCIPTECTSDEYEIKNNQCVKKEPIKPQTECSKTQLKKVHAIKGNIQDDKCVPTKCQDKYTLTNGQCIQNKADKKVVDKDSEEALKDAEKKYEDAKANEQSLANRTLTAVTTAATGIGGMELAQGLAEQKADKDAEMAMDAYIATMRCEYGNGKSVKVGTAEIELPGGNDPEMMKLRNEYFTLAQSLKERKEALGMKPGIESEIVLNKAQMGLYDDENTGITSGVYASLYRAKMGNETDQAKLQEMKDASKKRVIGGAIAVGAGIVGGIVGNQIINGKRSKADTKELAESTTKLSKSSTELLRKNRTRTVLSTADTNELLQAIQDKFK